MIFSCVYAQNYQVDFDSLGAREFENATRYFEKAVQESSENITANICYARAVGLGGNATSAVRHFKALSVQYPDQYEIKLNLAEAYMWDD